MGRVTTAGRAIASGGAACGPGLVADAENPLSAAVRTRRLLAIRSLRLRIRIAARIRCLTRARVLHGAAVQLGRYEAPEDCGRRRTVLVAGAGRVSTAASEHARKRDRRGHGSRPTRMEPLEHFGIG